MEPTLEEPAVAEPAFTIPPFRIGAGALQQFNATLDNGGRYGATHVYATAGAEFDLSESLELRIPAAFEFSSYRFRGSGTFDSAPWSEVYAVALAPRLTWTLSEHWAITAGPVVEFTGEREADIGDSIQWGGLGAVRYAFDRDHVIGLGLLVLTQLEDDPLFLPVPLVDWKLGDGWRISNVRGPEANPFAGLEVIKSLDAGWEVGAGAAYVTRRFRLSNRGPVPGGVGNDSGVPLFARLTYRPHPAFRIDLMAGVSVLNRLTLDNAQGDRLTASDADPAPLLGLFASLRF
ncbi:MAG: hypothetical protein KF724_10490 [Phycisphaeraceae bacterium]|nr:hypothetical protein [Phycisphaeraceae bacterium]